MRIVESLWILIGSLIIFLILLTDPKSAARGLGNNELTVFFSSVTEGQAFIRNFTWSLIAAFTILTLYINT